MKTYPVIYLLSFITLQLFWNSANATTIICGTIKDNDRANEIEVSNSIDHSFGHGTTQSFTLDHTGYFKFELDIKRPKFVLLRYKNRLKRIFVHNNDSLYAELEVKDNLRRITFLGEGSGENNFLNLFNYSFDEIPKKEALYVYLQNTDDLKTSRIQFIDENKDKYQLSEAFLKILTYKVEYSNLVGFQSSISQ